MNKNKLLKISVLLCIPAIGVTAPSAGDHEFTIDGSGTSDKDFDNAQVGASFSWGTYLSDNSEWGIRQAVNASDAGEDDTAWSGATRLFYDWNFNSGNDTRFVPYIGASLGYVYHEDFDNFFSAGPETGMKYYVLDDTFIQARAEYQFRFDSADEAEEAFDEGAWFYGFGMGYNY